MTTSSSWRPSATLAAIELRAELLARARRYFASSDVLEVETPLLVNCAVTDVHLESLEVSSNGRGHVGFLHTSPEYAMKRLLSAGAPDIYQIARVFRADERGRSHHPEFTMVEWYRHGYDDRALTVDVEQLVYRLLEGHVTTAPARRVSYATAFAERLGVDPLDAGASDLWAALRRAGVDVPATLAGDRDGLVDLGMSIAVAPSFATDRITFVMDFPASQAALARISGPVAARFEAFWGGLELANGFHELGDATEQAARFAADRSLRQARGQIDRTPDARFLAALATGLPDCAGVALGFDRVVMIAARAKHIDEVLTFTTEQA